MSIAPLKMALDRQDAQHMTVDNPTFTDRSDIIVNDDPINSPQLDCSTGLESEPCDLHAAGLVSDPGILLASWKVLTKKAQESGDRKAAGRILRMAIGQNADLQEWLEGASAIGLTLTELADQRQTELTPELMRHLSVLDQITRANRLLLAPLFTEGRLNREAMQHSNLNQKAALRAYKRVSRQFDDVEEAHFKRRNPEYRVSSVAEWIDRQPGLSEADKRLLADVDYLTKAGKCCWKSDARFALDFKTTRAAISQRILRLKRAGFLLTVASDLDARRRNLRVNTDKFIFFRGNKKAQSPQCDVKNPPTECCSLDNTVLINNQHGVDQSSTPRCAGPGKNNPQPAQNQEDTADISTAESEDEITGKNNNNDKPIAPDGATDRRGCSPAEVSPSATGGYAPSTPARSHAEQEPSPINPVNTGPGTNNNSVKESEKACNQCTESAEGAEQSNQTEDQAHIPAGPSKEVQKFFSFLKIAYPARFKNKYVSNPAHEQAANTYFEDTGDSALEIACIWSYGANLIGESVKNADGKIYRYGACNCTRTIDKYFSKLFRIKSDIISAEDLDFSEMDSADRISLLDESLPGHSKQLLDVFDDVRDQLKAELDAEKEADKARNRGQC